MTTHLFESMGTVVGIRTEGPLDPTAGAAIEGVFREYDEVYSLYASDSTMSRVATGRLRLRDAPESVRSVYALALEWRDRTGGAFTPHRPDGVIDLSGVVKALAIRAASDVLDDVAEAWLLNAGGDVLARGEHDGEPWSVGVVDPDVRDALAAVVPLTGTRRAVATSGTAERGEHIWRRGLPVFAQATVIADDIVTADVLATAVIAGSVEDLDRITSDNDIDAIVFAADGELRATPGAARYCNRVGSRGARP